MRNYNLPLPKYGAVYTVEEFQELLDDGSLVNYDGDGHWVLNNQYSREDEVFSSLPLDATHVIWFNK